MTAQQQLNIDARAHLDELHEAACWAVDGPIPKDVAPETSQIQTLLVRITQNMDAVGLADLLYSLVDSKRYDFTPDDIEDIQRIANDIKAAPEAA